MVLLFLTVFCCCCFLYEIRVRPSEYYLRQWLVLNWKSFGPQDVFEVRQRRVVVTKEIILFRTLLFCSKADFRSVKIRSSFFNEIVRVASSPKVRFEVDDVVIEWFCRGVVSKKSQGIIFNESFSDPGGWQEEKCVLESLCMFKVRTNVKDSRLIVESLRLLRINYSVKSFYCNTTNFKTRLQARGYQHNLIEKITSEIKFTERKSAL